MINAGKFRHKITICATGSGFDKAGFRIDELTPVLNVFAEVKTFKGTTLIRNNTDFEKATTAFIFRTPDIPLNRKMMILYKGKVWQIQYLNELYSPGFVEIQAKEVEH